MTVEPTTCRHMDLPRIYKYLQNLDPRLNPMHGTDPEKAHRALLKVEVILTILDKRLFENQYILLHARDVYHQLENLKKSLKGQPCEPLNDTEKATP